MFKRLRQNLNIKSSTRNKSPVHASVSKGKKNNNSYSYLSRKKTNNSEINNFQLAWICDHLYQGEFQNNKKHGEGVMILNNGVTVVGTWYKGYLDGNCIFFTPFGGKIFGKFIKGKLEGWCFVCYKQNVEINLFDRDCRNTTRTRFDRSEHLWVQSEYSEQGKLLKIVQLESGSIDKLPSFLQKKVELSLLYDKIIVRKQEFFLEKPLKKIRHQVMNQFEIYGYLNTHQNPTGLGIIYSQCEIFAGNFDSGSLDQHGMILFENGLLYKGEINQGKIEGDGAIYDPYLDETKIIKTNAQGFQTIIQEQNGFDFTEIPFNIGKIVRDPNFEIDYGFERGIETLCEEITKYYYKEHSIDNSEEGSIQESGIKYRDSLESSYANQYGSKKNNFLIPPPASDIKIYNEEDSQQKIQDISAPKSILGVPAKNAPRFQQFIARKSNKKNAEYPHLMQFERTTIVKFPHKGYEKPGMIYERPVKFPINCLNEDFYQ